MLCTPAVSAALLHAAVRVFPVPVRATAPQPLTIVPPSVNFTVPVGALPITVAVKATLLPTIAGFDELTSVVVVGAVVPPGVVTLSTRCDASADNTWTLMP